MGLVQITDKTAVIRKALGHEWDEGRVTKEPTETEKGVCTFTCQRDHSHTKTEDIPPTGGDPSVDPDKPEPEPDNTPSRRGGSGGSGGGSGRRVVLTGASAGGLWSQDAAGWHYQEKGSLVRVAWR